MCWGLGAFSWRQQQSTRRMSCPVENDLDQRLLLSQNNCMLYCLCTEVRCGRISRATLRTAIYQTIAVSGRADNMEDVICRDTALPCPVCLCALLIGRNPRIVVMREDTAAPCPYNAAPW